MNSVYLNFTIRIKEVIKKFNASAEIILFGSHARGDARKDSDWDILVLLNKPKVSLRDEQLIRHKLYEIELKAEQNISVFVYSKKEWHSKLSVTPLYQNIKKEGILL